MICRCGHDRDVHQHHRPGADCGRCGAARCPRYRRDHWLAARLRNGSWIATFLINLVGDVGRRPRHP